MSKGSGIDVKKFKPAIVYTIYIAASPEQTWKALTTAEFSRNYFSGFAIEADLKVGGAFIARAPDGSEHITGEVIECDPPKKLTVTWNVNWPALVEKLGPTLVTYEIEQAGDVVKLTMLQSHDRDISDDILSGGRTGWPAILSSLKSLLETGHALAIKMQPPERMLKALKEMGVGTPK
ncbi:SRPBCC family protein [Bradyrhizobium sp. CB3481]|uniref:SRPBCC family protein n=1 Tax=Bradyrhizobium sp. CB3481 TaxID=3039158 RepID=UPI0024B0C400|nr:SRPBCC family protein [Bradyrhizobium sp. CB3481]WFU16019.1 SRPBCC family protein [Bradyrhizobium sp. CB3481]